MHPFAARVAAFGGRLLARYGLWAIRPERVAAPGIDGWPRPAIAVCWHEGAFIGLAAQSFFKHIHPGASFVPPGLLGEVMRGWLHGYGGMQPFTLPPDRRGNPSATLKLMTRTLRGGHDIFIAVDGPHGPRLVVRPGALWLARVTGRPLLPVGLAAWPAFRWPKWDWHIVPLPGARVITLYGRPVWIDRDANLADEAQKLDGELVRLNARAWKIARHPARFAGFTTSIQDSSND
jgi:lysophospholipid acyltransferase (LPLAT)-like uncharacterized protein